MSICHLGWYICIYIYVCMCMCVYVFVNVFNVHIQICSYDKMWIMCLIMLGCVMFHLIVAEKNLPNCTM